MDLVVHQNWRNTSLALKGNHKEMVQLLFLKFHACQPKWEICVVRSLL